MRREERGERRGGERVVRGGNVRELMESGHVAQGYSR